MTAAAIQNAPLESWAFNQTQLGLANEPAWLQEVRAKNLAQFEQTGLPESRDEDWRYTNLAALKAEQFQVASSVPANLPALPTQIENSLRLVFVNGVFNANLSDQLGSQNGVSVSNLSSAIANESAVLKSHYAQSTPDDAHGFISLNNAFSEEGYVIEIDKNTQAERVIEVVFVSASNSSNAKESNGIQNIANTHNLIVTGTSSECRVIERFVGEANNIYLSNSVTEIVAGDNSKVDHYKVIEESDSAFHIGGVFVNQGRDANVSTHNVCLTGALTRNDVVANLLGQGGHCEMNGLVLGVGDQHIDNYTQVNHAVPNCTSDELYKTVLDDQSRSVFRGRIIVAEDAQQTNADQQNNNLILSDRAEADTKPQLEIYADDVQCSHGATVGQLDAKSLFYLRSRGISLDSARQLLTFAFANEVIERINIKQLSEELTHKLAGQLLDD